MEDALVAVLPHACFGLSVFILVFIARHLFESIAPTKVCSWWWQAILRGLPPAVGLVLVLVVGDRFPFPAALPTTRLRLVLYGPVVGFFSGYLYTVVKMVLEKKFGVVFPDDPTAPWTASVKAVTVGLAKTLTTPKTAAPDAAPVADAAPAPLPPVPAPVTITEVPAADTLESTKKA